MKEVFDFVRNECGSRVDDGVDRISQLPDEILFVILSFLRYKEAAATTVLSSRWLDLWKHVPDLKFDRISLLPNQIIAVILSFLQLKEAVATSVLSSRWSNLWKHTPSLNFFTGIDLYYEGDGDDDDDLWDAHRCEFVEMVNSVMQSHKAISLKRFILSVPGNRIAKCTVTKWLEFVFSRQIETLSLCFYPTDNLVLEELLRESRICLQPQTELIFFHSLKKLLLGCVRVSGEDIKLFLCDCPLLEYLSTISVTLTSDVVVCGANLLLKTLEICWCLGEKSIKVSTPNLTCMRFRQRRGVKVLIENVPKLVEAEFDIGGSDLAPSASCCFSQLQILKLDLFYPETFPQLHVILANGFTQMPNLKKLYISCDQTYNQNLLPVTTALMWAYPSLEEFKLWVHAFRGEQPADMQVMADVGRSPHQHLKVFELLMPPQNESDDLVELVTYISNNCAALWKIVIGRTQIRDPGDDDDVANRNWTNRYLADRDNLTQRLQGKVADHVQLEFV